MSGSLIVEALDILEACQGYEDDMDAKDHEFFTGIISKMSSQGSKFTVSERQIIWLRDIKARYVDLE